MKRFLLPITAILILASIAATVAPNIPISGMPIASTLQTNAWIPIIQPLPGRTTNDNFRVAPSAFSKFLGTNNTSSTNIFNTIIVTNLFVTNLTVININGSTNNTTNLWQIVGGTNLQPVDLTWRPTTQLGWTIGTNTSAHWSGGMTNGESLISSRNVDLGDRNNNEIFIETRGATNVGSVDINTKTNLSYIDQVVTIGSANYEISNVILGTDTDSQWIWGGYTVTDIHPTAPDGTAPYLFSTSTNHTTGNLVEVKSGVPPATTNAFTLAANSGFTGTGTKALTDDGTYKIVSGIGTGDLWTNNAGILEPVNPALQPMVVPGIFVGTNSMANYGGFVLTNGEVVIASRNTSVGDVDFAQYVQEVSNGVGGKTSTQLINDHRLSQIIQESVVGGFSFSKFQTTVDDSGAELILYGRPSTGVHLYPSAPWASTNSVMPYTFDTVFPGTFSGVRLVDFKDAGTNVLSIGPQGELFFGPGWTNVLYRDGIFLVYSNRPSGDGTYPGFSVRNPTDSSEVRISVGGGGLAYLTGTSAVGLSDNFVNGNEVRWSSKYLAPVTITNANLGGDGFTSLKPWGGVNQLTNTVWGYVSVVSTNYSRLRVTHTGTNGVGAGITFDSQVSGIGGNPRPFVFTNAPVQLPWFTSLQKTNLAEVANGMLIYQTDNTPGIRAYVNGAWVILQTAADP